VEIFKFSRIAKFIPKMKEQHMTKNRKISHSIQRKRLMARHKLKVSGRRLVQFIQDSQITQSEQTSFQS